MKRLPWSLLLVSTAVSAGLFDQPYSIIQSDPLRSPDPLLRAVIVNRVDDRNALPDNRAVVDPGRHAVTIDLPPRKGFHTATQTTFELETKPCTRYYVAARLESQTSQRWTAVVRSEEPIGECAAKFSIAGAK